MERPLIAVRPDVEFQGLELDARLIGYIDEIEFGEVRLAGFGSKTGEFRDPDMDLIVAFRMGVGEGLELLGRFGRHFRL